MNVKIGAKTDVGRVREVNEDSYLVHEPLFVVADGMGGHTAGDVASSTAIDTIKGQSSTANPEDMETLAELVRGANAQIWEKANSDPTLRGMGTTCTLLLLDGAKAHFAHVGDSRAYLLREGELTQLTEDHTLVGRMVKEGRLTAEEAENHPQRSVITRALGVDSEVEVDLLSVEVAGGDRLLICSDGLSSMIDSDAITKALTEESKPQSAAERLIEFANEAGGEDNITVVVLDFDGDGGGAKAAAWKREDTLDSPPPTAPKGGASAPSSSEMTLAPGSAGATDAGGHERSADTTSSSHDEGHDERPARTWPRKLVAALVVLALLAAALFFGGRYLLSNSWYVGVNEDGFVTVYEGIPEEVAGLSLRVERDVTDIRVDDLPDFLVANVSDGIKMDSLEDAEQQISDFEQQVDAGEQRRERERQRNTGDTKD